MEILLRSKKTGQTYPAEIYAQDAKDNRRDFILLHKSLNDIYAAIPDGERPKKILEPFDLSKWPSIPPMFAIKCTLGDCVGIGEMMCLEWQEALETNNQIKVRNPLAICTNRAFDKAFIQYMQFCILADNQVLNGNIYSSSEMVDMSNAVVLDGRNVFSTQLQPASEVIPHPTVPVTQQSQQMAQPPYQGMPQLPPQQAYAMAQQAPVMPPDSNMAQAHGVPMPQVQPPYQSQPQQMPPQQMPPAQNVQINAGPQQGQVSAPAQAAANGGGNQTPSQNQPQGNLLRPEIVDIEYDMSQQITRICTDLGIVYFSHTSHTWSFEGSDASALDIQWLYNKASQELGQPLETFCGFNS